MKQLQKIGMWLFCLLFLLLSYQGNATHVIGGGITYKCVGPSEYEINLTFYRDCNGLNFPGSRTISWTGGCGSGSVTVLPVAGSRKDITPRCAGQSTSCNGGTGGFGVEEQTYSAVVTLPVGCSNVLFSWSLCCRNNAISSINGSLNLYTEATLTTSSSGSCDNNSAYFNNPPALFTCVNDTFVYDAGGTDPDGDSLVYSLVDAKESLNTSIFYVGGYSGTQPFGAANPVSIDPNTGILRGYLTNTEVTIIAIMIEEYRNGILVGSIIRDVQFRVLGCSNSAPALTGINGGTTPSDYIMTTCPNTPICFDLMGTDPDGDNVGITWDNAIIGATFSSNADTAQFCWTPQAFNLGMNTFTATVSDSICPISRSRPYTYTINVVNPNDPINAGVDQQICKGDSTTLAATTAASNIQNITWSPNIGLSNPNSLNPKASPSSSIYYTITLEYTDGCISQDQVYVEVIDKPLLSVYPQSTNVCGGVSFSLSATANMAGMNFSWFDPSMVALGAGTINANTSTLNITTPNIAGSYDYIIVCDNPTTLCSTTEVITLHVLSPTGTTKHIYVSNTGLTSAAGTALAPTTLAEALNRAACDNTIIKMDTGIYNIDSTLFIPSYITLEGGFMQGNAWKKTSEVGATVIRRSALNPDGLANAQRLVALAALSSQNFRLQDLTIATADATNSGMSTYGLHLQNTSQYTLARVQVLSGNAVNGANGVDGAGRSTMPFMDGVAGVNGYPGTQDPIQGGGGTGGDGGFVTAITSGGFGGTFGGTQGSAGQDGNDVNPATVTQCTRNGGSGGGGGSGGCSNCVTAGNIANTGYDGGLGGRGGSSSSVCPTNPYFGTCGTAFSGSPFGFGTITGAGLGGASGANGTNGADGQDGEPGCDGALGAVGNHSSSFPFWTVGGQGQRGEHGEAGSGGGGAGGSGNSGVNAGNGGGGGGGGAAGGEAGSGGFAGGASFGVYIVDNGANGTIIDCKITAGNAGLGGIGGAGGAGGLGGAGGAASTVNGISSGAGGSGGDGGYGGAGGDGQAGISQNIYIGGASTALLSADSTHNFLAEAIIWVTDVNTIGQTVEFVDPNLPIAAASTNWDFDVYSNNAIPATASDNSDSTAYSINGRYSVEHAGYTYEGFHHIMFNANAQPNINSTANNLNADTLQLCLGDLAAFYSDKIGDTLVWNFDGAITNPGNVQNTSFVQFNAAGFYTITLRVGTVCCGASPIDTIYLWVDAKPTVTGSGSISYCQGGSGALTLTGLSASDSVIWTPTVDLNIIQKDSVLVNPNSTTTYIATVYNQNNNRLSCPASISFDVIVQQAAQISLTATNLTCNSDGTATVTVNNGVGPYTYNWSTGASTSTGSSSNTITGLASGAYTVTVLDLGTINSCDTAATIFVYSGASAPNLGIFNRIDPSCVGSNNGEAMAMIINGTAPYNYTWTGPVIVNPTTNVSSQTASGLIPGTYTVTATDALGCEDITSFVIVDPAPVTINVQTITNPSCLNDNNGELVIEGFGGTGTYNYTWNDGQIAQSNNIGTLSNLDLGEYQITVADANSCETYTTITLIPQNQDSAGINFDPLLAGTNPQIFVGDSYTIDGYSSDSANLNYSWTSAASLSCSNCLNPIASPTQTTTYYFTANPPATGCVFEDSITIEVYPNNPTDTLYFAIAPDSIVSACVSLPNFIVGTQGSFGHVGAALSGSLSTPSYACFDFIAGNIGGATDTLILVTCEQLCDTTVVIISTNTCVWAGDTNEDLIANNVDLLPIGLHMGATGLVRPNANLSYTCQPSPDWGVGLLGQPITDIKHIDTDGNAVINNDDTLAIVQNWGQIHLRNGSSSSLAGIPLYVDTLVANSGDTLHLPIILGDINNTVADAYGLAFSIDYDQTNIKPNSVYVTYDNTWIGTNLNSINIQKDFYIMGELEIALTRTNQTAVNGFGQIGTLHLVIKDIVNSGAAGAVRLDFGVKDVHLIDNLGNLIPVDNKLTQVLVLNPATSITQVAKEEGTVQILPNPSSAYIEIKTTDQQIEQAKFYALDGKLIKSYLGNGQKLNVNLQELPAGIYIIAVQTEQAVYNERLIIRR